MDSNDVTIDDLITKARARLGEESALRSVDALRFIGRMETPGTESQAGGEDGDAEPIEIVLDFKRPNLQRMVRKVGNERRVTVLDGSEGFIYSRDEETGRTLLHVMPSEQVQFFLNNSRENLNFFLGPKTVPGGEIKLIAETIRRGVPVYRIRFEYPSGNQYDRFYDRETMELLSTQLNPSDNELIQKGEQVFSGIRFPKRLETYSADGHLTQTFYFDEVIVNPEFPEDHFTLPEQEIFGYGQE